LTKFYIFFFPFSHAHQKWNKTWRRNHFTEYQTFLILFYFLPILFIGYLK